jgi:hypothetical protein
MMHPRRHHVETHWRWALLHLCLPSGLSSQLFSPTKTMVLPRSVVKRRFHARSRSCGPDCALRFCSVLCHDPSVYARACYFISWRGWSSWPMVSIFPDGLLNEFKSIQTDDVVCGLFVSLFTKAEVRTFRVRWHRFCFATNAALNVWFFFNICTDLKKWMHNSPSKGQKAAFIL